MVVGIDGSAGSDSALAWALAHAREDDLIRAVYVWQVPRGATPDFVPASELATIRPDADRFVADVVDNVLKVHEGQVPQIERVSYYGHPGRWLVKLSAESDMIVVGSRGRGGFVGLLLGSVSTYVTHHALCPVVVVPAGRTDTAT